MNFQQEVAHWMTECWKHNPELITNVQERCHRFVEESLELVQSLEMTEEDAHRLVEYVYGRPKGEPQQEVGGAMVTLAALCNAAQMSMSQCGMEELHRCWNKIDRIRKKQVTKPHHSPLPGD